eukprot:13737727-Alexandrium_andersonii.AAC.1
MARIVAVYPSGPSSGSGRTHSQCFRDSRHARCHSDHHDMARYVRSELTVQGCSPRSTAVQTSLQPGPYAPGRFCREGVCCPRSSVFVFCGLGV